MKCRAYPSVKKHSRYVIVPSDKAITDLPKGAQDEIGTNKPWKEFDLDADQPRIALDPEQAMKNIESQGYHVQDTGVVFEEIVTSVPSQRKLNKAMQAVDMKQGGKRFSKIQDKR